MSVVFRKNLIIILIGTIFSSCATVKPTENQVALASWIDISYVDVINQLGTPDFVFVDGLNGRVLVYRDILTPINYQALNAYRESFEEEAYDIVWYNSLERNVPTRISQSYDLLYVDRDGYIYSYQSNKSSRVVRIQQEKNLIIGGVFLGALTMVLLVIGE